MPGGSSRAVPVRGRRLTVEGVRRSVVIYPWRVLRSLGRSGDRLAGLGANPHRTMRRWWSVSQTLARRHSDLLRPCLRQLSALAGPAHKRRRGRRVKGGLGHLGHLVMLSVRALDLSTGTEPTPTDLMHAETALNDLSINAAQAAQAISDRLRRL